VEILAVIQGTVSALDMPVRQSFAVEMVGREDLPNAIALNSSVFNAARLIGPALAGLLVAAVGEAWCFTFNTASFLAVIAALAAMRLAPRVITPSKASILSAAGEGLSYSFRTRPLRYLFLTIGTLSFAGLPYATLIPVFADKQLAGGATANGMLLGANGLGAMVGALILAARTSLTGTAQRIVLSGILFGAGLIAFAFCRVYAGSLLLMVVVGFAMITMIGSCNTLIQSMVSDLYRGRVMAVYTMVLVGIGPFGSLLAGWLAERWGAPVVVAGGGGLCILSGLILQTVLTELRDDARAMMGIDKGSPDPVGANHS
jgi:MFS family permease